MDLRYNHSSTPNYTGSLNKCSLKLGQGYVNRKTMRWHHLFMPEYQINYNTKSNPWQTSSCLNTGSLIAFPIMEGLLIAWTSCCTNSWVDNDLRHYVAFAISENYYRTILFHMWDVHFFVSTVFLSISLSNLIKSENPINKLRISYIKGCHMVRCLIG